VVKRKAFPLTITVEQAVIAIKSNTMKKLNTQKMLAGLAITIICLLSAFASRPGGYGYTVHLNNKLVGEYYLTSTHLTPTVTVQNADLKSSLAVYFNECGQIGGGRKLSVRSVDQKILKEWSFANSTAKHDAMEVSIQDVGGLLASGKVAIYYASERVTKPQLLVYLSTETIAKSKASLK
jgi:hypothetical protein